MTDMACIIMHCQHSFLQEVMNKLYAYALAWKRTCSHETFGAMVSEFCFFKENMDNLRKSFTLRP